MLKKIKASSEFPEPFLVAATHIRQKDYGYSITELQRPLQMLYLQKHHDYEIEVENIIKALIGTAFHDFMEHQTLSDPNDYVVEERYYKEINGVMISGQIDMYHKSKQTLWDYKTSGMYKINKMLHGELKVEAKDWMMQTNCYRFLSGLPCSSIKILAVMTDFKKNNTYRIKNNPVVFDIPLVKLDQIEKWLFNRVGKIKRMFETNKYPECTLEETWNGIRCKDWCEVSQFCSQNQKTSKGLFA